MVLHRRSSEPSSAGSAFTLACIPPMQPTPCGEKQLLGRDLELWVIKPTTTAGEPEPRYRCPIAGCLYKGAKINHAGECLKHVMDPKQLATEHHRFLVNKLVCFHNAEGMPALHSKTVVPSAFPFRPDKEPSVKALAYMKVGHMCVAFLTSAACVDSGACCRL